MSTRATSSAKPRTSAKTTARQAAEAEAEAIARAERFDARRARAAEGI